MRVLYKRSFGYTEPLYQKVNSPQVRGRRAPRAEPALAPAEIWGRGGVLAGKLLTGGPLVLPWPTPGPGLASTGKNLIGPHIPFEKGITIWTC